MQRRSFVVLTGATAAGAALASSLLLRSCAENCSGPCGPEVEITWDADVLPEADFVEVCARDCEEVEPYRDSTQPGRAEASVLGGAQHTDVQLFLQTAPGEGVSIFARDLTDLRNGCGCRELRFRVSDDGEELVRLD